MFNVQRTCSASLLVSHALLQSSLTYLSAAYTPTIQSSARQHDANTHILPAAHDYPVRCTAYYGRTARWRWCIAAQIRTDTHRYAQGFRAVAKGCFVILEAVVCVGTLRIQ